MSDQALYYQSPTPQGRLAEGQIILRDGSTAELRPVQDSDRDLLTAFLARMSKEGRTRRFFGEVSPRVGRRTVTQRRRPG